MNKRKYEFGSSNSLDPLSRVADLFDIQHTKDKGDAHWEQEVRGVLSKYRTSEQVSGGIKDDQRSVFNIIYKVVGYDEALMSKRKREKLTLKRRDIGVEILACDLFKSDFAIKEKPNKYIDEFGNIYEKQED